MCNRMPSRANAAGKPVKSSTIARMSHTWFASHTGPIACAMRSRWRSLRRPPASSAQIGRAHVELQSQSNLVCRLLLEKKKKIRERPHHDRSHTHLDDDSYIERVR